MYAPIMNHGLTGFQRVDIDQVYRRLALDDGAVGSLDWCAARCNLGNGELLAKQPASLENNNESLSYTLSLKLSIRI